MIYSVGEGANEFNESQKNNLLKLIQYTNQDCFTFEAAQKLSEGQIDIMIENKKKNMLDYYAVIGASEINVLISYLSFKENNIFLIFLMKK